MQPTSASPGGAAGAPSLDERIDGLLGALPETAGANTSAWQAFYGEAQPNATVVATNTAVRTALLSARGAAVELSSEATAVDDSLAALDDALQTLTTRVGQSQQVCTGIVTNGDALVQQLRLSETVLLQQAQVASDCTFFGSGYNDIHGLVCGKAKDSLAPLYATLLAASLALAIGTFALTWRAPHRLPGPEDYAEYGGERLTEGHEDQANEAAASSAFTVPPLVPLTKALSKTPSWRDGPKGGKELVREPLLGSDTLPAVAGSSPLPPAYDDVPPPPYYSRTVWGGSTSAC